MTTLAMGEGRYPAAEHFPEQVQYVVAYLDDAMPPEHPFAGVKAMPAGPGAPQVWLLGSSDYSGALAAQLGLRFAFAHFISARGGDEVARGYRALFDPGYEPKPYCAVALFVISADTQGEADALASAVDLRRVQMAYGMNAPIPTVEQARDWQPDERARAVIAHERPRSIIGTPQRVVERMLALQASFEADEVIVLSVAASYAARLRTYELLAQAFELDRAGSCARVDAV